MAVFTEVSEDEARVLMQRLGLGDLCALRGIEGGIENTNYFASTMRDGVQHDYVLTLFERLTAEQLPFYLYLMKHLAQRGVAVPDPQADRHGEILHSVNGKPAAVVNKLRGKSQLAPQAVRPLTAAERELLPAMLRAGALRFWISRLWDFYLPREASMLKPHDPTHFERVLRGRLALPVHAG